MAKITELPTLEAPDGTETVPVVRGGVTYRARIAALLKSAVDTAIGSLASMFMQHITDTAWSVSDENGNSPLLVDTNGVTRARALSAGSLIVEDPISAGLPLTHITDFVDAIADENGWALTATDSKGRVIARSFSLADGSTVGAGGMPRYMAGTTNAQIDGIGGDGQSNFSGDTNNVTNPPINESQTQPYANLTPLYGEAVGFGTTYDSANANAVVKAIVPLLAPANYCEWGGIQAANKVTEMLLRDSSLGVADVPQIYAWNSAFRGSGIDYIGNQANGVSFKIALRAGVSYARSVGKTYNQKAILFSQGESQASALETDYLGWLLQYYNRQNADAKLVTGQTNNIELFLWQLQEKTTPTSASMLAAQRHEHIHCAFPEYAGRMKTGNFGHFDNIGMALASAYYGVAVKRVCYDRADWRPLEHISLARVGARRVLVQYNRKGLVWESDQPNPRWTAQAGRGFYGTDGSGALVVADATVSRHGLVTITFSRDVVGDLTFGYGRTMTGRDDGADLRGGDLRDCAGLTETAMINGIAWPLHNRALCFEETIYG